VNGYCNGPDRCSCISGYTGFGCEIPICNPPCPNTTEGGWCIGINTCNATSTTEFEIDQQNVEGEDEQEESAFPMEVVIGVVAGVLAFCIIVVVFVGVLKRRNAKKKHLHQAPDIELEFSGFGKYIIPYKKLKFKHKLGEGNFGEGKQLC
jgi:hypothetical protein